MYMTIGSGSDLSFIDPELLYLERLLAILDKELEGINDRKSERNDNYCLFDEGEYFVGVGFCAMQRYIVDVLEGKELIKHKMLDIGPKTKNKTSIARIINDAANHWKHSPEWPIDVQNIEPTAIVVSEPEEPWPQSNLLWELCNRESMTLINCVQYLIEWRREVHEINKPQG